ncbi:TolC family protein [Aestuariibacter salexigens]|uniref:TolC family protein n=1 Tax=Aestuariibacter salexigens TaxID=226010 RepID=UPI0004221019|nr:TolC family protein [Aestuariibacter salexigens]
MKKLTLTLTTLLLCLAHSLAYADAGLSLQQAINAAQQNDPWLHGNRLKQQAVESRSEASSVMPDPRLSVGLMNLPVDGWDVNQEPMTQLSVGLSQMFPRGDSLAIKSSQLKIKSTQFPLLRQDRLAKIETVVSELWLDAYLAQATIGLIEKDWQLFEQMAEVAKASYANAVGKTRQQDVIRAQLEIVQLEDRLAAEQQKFESATARLSEWLHRYDASQQTVIDFNEPSTGFTVSAELPELALTYPQLVSQSAISTNALAEKLSQHPAVLAVDIEYQAAKKSIELAEQQYEPQWGVSASYGLRGDTPSGQSRADFFSLGVSVDLPLFTDRRQDNELSASIAESEAVKTDKLLLIKRMLSEVEKESRQLMRLQQRQAIYQQQLLTQIHEQAEASLTAYTNDDGDFAEVVRARIAELNAQIAALQIDVQLLKTVVRLNYFFAGADTTGVN